MRFLRADTFPERVARQRRSGLDKFRSYLEKRWAEGCHNASQLWRELQQQGYAGQRSRVKKYLQAWQAKPSPRATVSQTAEAATCCPLAHQAGCATQAALVVHSQIRPPSAILVLS